MKRKWLIVPFLTLAFILILTLLPISFVSADPGNLVTNGDFSEGSDGLNGWTASDSPVVVINEELLLGPGGYPLVEQDINTSNKNLIFSLDIKPIDYGADGGYLRWYFGLYLSGSLVDWADTTTTSLPLNGWTHWSSQLSDWYGSELPDFDQIRIWVQAVYNSVGYFDNIKLEPPTTQNPAEPVWIRDREMTCKQIWINEDNKFQFSFIYPYRDNNWVKIYDMSGKLVYEVDMPLDNPNIIVDLPDGMYTVKTFHDQPSHCRLSLLVNRKYYYC